MSGDDVMNLSQMKYYKQRKGYSFAKLSELSGVPVGTIQKIFTGETKSPRYDTLQALEKVLKPAEDDRVGEAAVQYLTDDYEEPKGPYTLDDYYALPEDKRVELIDGEFFEMLTPSFGHQYVSMQISLTIGTFIKSKKGKCIVLVAPVDVQLDCDDKTMLEPDVLILCDKSKITNRCIMGAPDFVVEILSPSTRKKDAFLKLKKYMCAGVREYWMIDLEGSRIVTYFFEDDEFPVIYGMDQKVPVRLYGGELEIDFGQISEELRDMES